MIKIIFGAILAFLISLPISFFSFMSLCNGGFACIGWVLAAFVYVPMIAGILSIPMYFLLTRYLFQHPKIFASIIIVIVMFVMLFILPK